MIAANCTTYFENKPPIMNLIENKPAHDFGVGSSDAIQIQPQRAKLRLRKCVFIRYLYCDNKNIFGFFLSKL